ncbi:MAG: ABC transporter ATP-binding protein [Bacteroidales bacterium]|nr:ABC transporter ATP-binding protein [Bacteroidales bacterium]
MKREETIRISGLSIGYRGKHGIKTVAEGISKVIRSGELTCLLGENGAGKSTLLRTLSGFLPPLSGEIYILGKSLNSYRERELATVIGVVLTEKTNLQNMTVAELVGMGRSPYTGFWGRLSAEDRRKVDDALDLVGIVPLRDRMVQTLSDGERQKVMIAKALAQETPVIFLDEPTAFLDYPSKVEILHLLHRLSREMGKTIFLSTHDLELALQIADQLWLMARGRGVTVGTPEDLALDGVLDTFFRRKGVAFEKQTGLYRIESEYRSAVRLSGDPVACEMVRKALRRDAIRADFDIEAPVSVHAVINPDGKPSFTVSDASQRPSVPSGEVHSVAGLLDLLSEFRS